MFMKAKESKERAFLLLGLAVILVSFAGLAMLLWTL